MSMMWDYDHQRHFELESARKRDRSRLWQAMQKLGLTRPDLADGCV